MPRFTRIRTVRWYSAMRRPFGKDYVQVVFPGDPWRKRYTYYCPGAEVGKLVQVPPNRLSAYRQSVRVVKLGRGYLGRIKQARL